MCRDLVTQLVVVVEGAGPNAIGGDDGDVVEHYLLDVEQRAVHVVSAPLGRTVALAAVELGLDQTARSGGIGGLHAYGVTSRTERQDRRANSGNVGLDREAQKDTGFSIGD